MAKGIYVENFPNDQLYCVAIFFPHAYVIIWLYSRSFSTCLLFRQIIFFLSREGEERGTKFPALKWITFWV